MSFKKYLNEEMQDKEIEKVVESTEESKTDLNEASGESLYVVSYDKTMGLEIKSKDGKQTIWLEGMSSKEDKVLAEVGSKLKSMDLQGSFNIRV